MPYDEGLAERVRIALGARAPFGEIKMFGGLCFTVNGNMALGVLNDDLMVRVGAERYDEAVAKHGARPMDFTKRPMPGFVFVGSDATGADAVLAEWVDMAMAYVLPMPPKQPKVKTRPLKPSVRR